MELSTNVMVMICAVCVVAIGGIFVAWRRGVFGPKSGAPEAVAKSAE